MSFVWTETLSAPLAEMTRGGAWERIEAGRDGGWNLLARAPKGAEPAWYHAVEGGRPGRLGPSMDRRLHIAAALDRWRGLGHVARLLSWRVGRRAVFLVTSPDGERICKLYHRAEGVLDRWRALSGDDGGSWSAPRVLDWDQDLRMITIERCRGASLGARWREGYGDPSDGDRIAALLLWLAALPPAGLPPHGAAEESEVIRRAFAAHERAVAQPHPQAGSLVTRVVDALRLDAPVAPVLCHRDLHDGQMLIDGGSETRAGGCVIDLDLAASGQPALDAGNILAHARLCALQGFELPWREIAQSITRRVSASGSSGGSLHRWTAAALLRLALVYSLRERPVNLVDDLLESAVHALAREGEWKGIL